MQSVQNYMTKHTFEECKESVNTDMRDLDLNKQEQEMCESQSLGIMSRDRLANLVQ